MSGWKESRATERRDARPDKVGRRAIVERLVREGRLCSTDIANRSGYTVSGVWTVARRLGLRLPVESEW